MAPETAIPRRQSLGKVTRIMRPSDIDNPITGRHHRLVIWPGSRPELPDHKLFSTSLRRPISAQITKQVTSAPDSCIASETGGLAANDRLLTLPKSGAGGAGAQHALSMAQEAAIQVAPSSETRRIAELLSERARSGSSLSVFSL
jgi:hypothetical protein